MNSTLGNMYHVTYRGKPNSNGVDLRQNLSEEPRVGDFLDHEATATHGYVVEKVNGDRVLAKWKELLLTPTQLQKEIHAWSQKALGESANVVNSMRGLAEELGELNRCYICRDQKRKGYDDPEKFEADRNDSVADLGIFLLNFCEQEGIDFLYLVNKAWAHVQKRTRENWEEHAHDKPSPEPSNDPDYAPTVSVHFHELASVDDSRACPVKVMRVTFLNRQQITEGTRFSDEEGNMWKIHSVGNGVVKAVPFVN